MLQQDQDTTETDLPTSPDSTGRRMQRLGLRAPTQGRASLGGAALLVAVVLSRTLGHALMRRLLTSNEPVLICVSVPDRTWFDPLRDAADDLLRRPIVHVWDSTVRRSFSDPSVNEVIGNLSLGRAVLCVSQDVAALVPRAVRTVSDAIVSLTSPEAGAIALAIGLVRGGRGPSRVTPDLGQGLSLHEIAACLYAGTAPRAAVARIRRAMASKGKEMVDPTAPRLEDLHGYGEAAVWGRRVSTEVTAYRAGTLTWGQVSGPAVLHGPPGTGKTLFGRALAKSVGAPLIASSASAWFQSGASDLGAVIRAASGVFDEARVAVRDCGVAVLLIDELDSLPARSALDAGRASWWRPVVNHFLTLVDGATSDLRGIILLAATNDIRAVDPAVLRPGRFGTALRVDPPSVADLAGVMRYHLGAHACMLTAGEIEAVLQPLQGATQAQAASWAADAIRRARDVGRTVNLDDLIAAVLPVDRRTGVERRRSAVHEAGHAVAGWHLARERFGSVSIIGTPDTNGRTIMLAQDNALPSRDEIENEVVIILCGRAADVVIGAGANAGAGGTGLTGATSDLAMATSLLTAVHAAYGLGLSLRYRGEVNAGGAFLDDEVARLVEADLQRLMTRAETVVSVHAAEVEAVARALLERGFLTKAEVGAISASA